MSVSSHGHTRTHSQPYTQHTRQPSSSTLPPLPQTPGKSPRTAFSHTSHHPPTERDFDSELGLTGDAGDIDYDGQGDITVEEAEGRQEDAVHFCLLAEFDIDAGATLAHQYPYPTGTDEHRLAELMLPDGAHLRAEDWTIFYLGQTPSSAIAPMFSHEDQVPSSTRTSTDNEDMMAAVQNGRSSIGGSVDSGNLGVGSTEEILESASVTITKPKRGVAGGGLLYVLNCVRMKEDKKMRRGAMVKAMAICTPNPYIGIYKPLLLLALEEYFISPSPEILARLYDSANAISVAGMPRLSRSERILLRQSERKDLFEDKFILPDPAYLAGTKEYFDDEEQQAKSDEGSNGGITDADLISNNSHASRPQSHQRHTKQMSVSSRMSARPEIGLRKGSGSSSQYRQTTPSSREGRYTPEAIIGQSRKGIPRDTHFFETEARFKKITVPIRIPMTVFDEDVGDYSIIELVNAFSQQLAPFPPPFHPHLHTNGPLTHPVILIFNALIANKRVMFLGHGLPANQVARMVLAACALVSGCGQVLRGITESAFPYANLASLDILEEFNSGFVAGVTNPRFEELPSTWDVLCNLETGKVTVSKELKGAVGPNPALVNMGMSKGSGRSSESSLDKSIVKVDEDTGTAMSTPAGKQAAQSRADCVDNQFMEDILSAMQSHYGEPHIRLRFTDYLIRFIRLASYQEFIHTGSTKIGYPTIPCKEGLLGSGTVFGDDQSKSREMWGNGYRIEAWRKTKSYKLYVKDWARWQRKRAVSGFDVQHQISRLRLGKNMSDGEAEMIFSSLATLRSYDQIVELLTLLPPHLGGLTPLANGLFHRWPGIRESTVEIVLNLQQFAVGRQAVAAMNYYHRKTFLQLIERRAQQREQEQLRSDRYSQISGSPIIPYSQYSHSFSHSRSQTGSELGYEAVTSPGTVHGSMPSTPQGVRGTQES